MSSCSTRKILRITTSGLPFSDTVFGKEGTVGHLKSYFDKLNPLRNDPLALVGILLVSVSKRKAGTPIANQIQAQGTVYTGETWELRPNGHGVVVYPDGKKVEGIFANGVFVK